MYAHDGTTKRGGYRYTSISFKQVAQLLAPGLSTILPDLSGDIKRKNVDEAMTDVHRAREIFNTFVTLRIPLLRTYRLLRNEDEKTIDGIIGQKHRSLENLTMLSATSDAISAVASRDMEFHAGLVTGRKLVLWYRSNTPMFTMDIDDTQWPFHYGYYFCNAESTGTSVRGSLTVYTKHGTCMAPFTKGSRVTHIGRDFSQRLSKMFQHILGADVPVKQFSDGLAKLLDTPLNYVNLDERGRRAFERKIVRALQEVGLPQGWAKECFNNTLSTGRVRPQDLKPSRNFKRLYESRTYFDVLCPIIRMAAQLPGSRREAVEQAAYKVLIGKLSM